MFAYLRVSYSIECEKFRFQMTIYKCVYRRSVCDIQNETSQAQSLLNDYLPNIGIPKLAKTSQVSEKSWPSAVYISF